MNITISKTNQEFLDSYSYVLTAYPERTQLLFVNVNQNLNEPLSTQDCRGAIIKNNEPILLFVNPLPWRLQLFSVSFYPVAIEQLVEYLIEHLIPISGVQGNHQNTRYFVEYYQKKTAMSFKSHLQLDIMRLEKVVPYPAPYPMEYAMIKDLETVLNFRMGFHQEALNENSPRDILYDKTVTAIEENKIRVLRNKQGQITTMVMLSREMENGIAISLVYTPKEYRGRGYSTSLVSQLCEELLEKGYEFVTLYVDQANPISNHVYTKIGFKIIEDSIEYELLQ